MLKINCLEVLEGRKQLLTREKQTPVFIEKFTFPSSLQLYWTYLLWKHNLILFLQMIYKEKNFFFEKCS